MAEVNLRTYIQEIDSLIEEGQQIDEAIAHCRHILQTYPKHIETYRLLGKAYLESKRFGDAADIFQRVLSAIPDDLVSHAGMAIIREDEGNLDASIWHMERASEAKPGNAAIEQELKRLIGRRDGVEPQRIRPTRGALARMYYNGELYPYAANELRMALEEDGDRPDLQILLAKAFWHTDQRIEAANLCNQILEKLPYCYDANRIAAALLQASGKSDEAVRNLRRLIALDAYRAFIDSPMDDANQVEGNAIQIERYAWSPGRPLPPSEGEQPDWAASLGVDFRGERQASPKEKEVPTWLKYSESPEQQEPMETEPVSPVHPFAGAKPPPGVEIPDWMQESGWKGGTGEVTEGPIDYSEVSEGPSLATAPEPGELMPAQLPDWLSEIIPQAQRPAKEEAPSIPAYIPEGEQRESDQVFPEWISDLGAATGEGFAAEEAFPESQAPFSEDNAELQPEDLSEISQEIPPWLEPSMPGATDTIVSWLGDKSFDESPSPPEDVPPWMRGTGPLQEIIPAEAQPAAEEIREDRFRPTPKPTDEPLEESIFDKIAFAPGEQEQEQVPPLELEEPFTSDLAPGDSPPDWLQAISEVQGESLENEIISPDEAPEWLDQYESPMEEPSPSAAPFEAPEWLTEIDEDEFEPSLEEISEKEEPPDWLKDVVAEELPPMDDERVFEEEKKPDWLEGLSDADLIEEKAPAAEIEAPPDWIAELSYTEPEEAPLDSPKAEEPPDWIRALAESDTEDQPEASVEAEIPLDFPEKAGPAAAEEPAAPSEIGEPPPLWLQGLESPPSGAEESQAQAIPELPTEPTLEEAEEETPEWLAAIQGPPEEPDEEVSKRMKIFAAEKEPEALPADAAPDWLQDISAPSAEIPESPTAEALDWLAEIEATEREPTLVAEEQSGAEVPAFPSDAAPEADQTPEAIEEPVWELEFETPEVVPEEIEGTSKADLEERLMWLQETAEEISPEPSLPEEAPKATLQPQVSTPEELVPAIDSPMEDEEVFSFLEDLAASQIDDESEIPSSTVSAIPETPLAQKDKVQEQLPPEPQDYPEELDESLMWLEQLAVDEEVKGIAHLAEIQADEDLLGPEMPDWLEEVALPGEPPIGRPSGIEPQQERASQLKTLSEMPLDRNLPQKPSLREELLPEEQPFIPQDLEEQFPPRTEGGASGIEAPDQPIRPAEAEAPELEGLHKADGFPAAIPRPKAAAGDEPMTEPARDEPQPPTIAKPAATKAEKRQASPAETLSSARSAFERGNVDQALDQYSKLIDRGVEIEAIIHDLNSAVDRTPNAPLLWQVLGDAYMKQGEISRAIDAYRHGMEAI